jgi:hypothetical protein
VPLQGWPSVETKSTHPLSLTSRERPRHAVQHLLEAEHPGGPGDTFPDLLGSLTNAGPGPLPWIPAVPATLTEHATWGPYLTAPRRAR